MSRMSNVEKDAYRNAIRLEILYEERCNARINVLEENAKKDDEDFGDTTVWDKCKCLIRKRDAHVVREVVAEQRWSFTASIWLNVAEQSDEAAPNNDPTHKHSMKETFFCHRCKPKKRKVKADNASKKVKKS